MTASPVRVFVLNATTDSDVLLPVVSTSESAEGALFVQVQWGNGSFEWLKPAEYRAAYYNQSMESWQPVLTPDEFEVARNYAAQMRAAAAAFDSAFLGRAS